MLRVVGPTMLHPFEQALSLRGRLFFFGEGGGGKSLQTYQQYFIFRGREMPRNAIGRNCDICQILHKLHLSFIYPERGGFSEIFPEVMIALARGKYHH